MSLKNITKLFTVLTFLILLPTFALAAPNSSLPSIKNPFDSLQVPIPGMARFTEATITQSGNNQTLQVNWIAEYIYGLYNYAIGIIGIFAVVGIAIGGVIWIMSAGNPSLVNAGKDWVVSSVLGLLLALGSYLILNSINPDLVNYYNQNLHIARDSDLDPSTMTAGGGILSGPYTGSLNIANNLPQFDELLRQASAKYGVDCTLAKATMLAESRGRPDATSNFVGKDGQTYHAYGLMQLRPATFASMGGTGDIYDVAANIDAGVKYMSVLYSTACNNRVSNGVCDANNVVYRIAAYNGGPGCNAPSVSCSGQTIWQCTDNPGYGETRNYVIKVQGYYNGLIEKSWGC